MRILMVVKINIMFTRKLSFTPIKYPKARAMGITRFPYYEYDSNGNQTYREESKGSWFKSEYDSNGNSTYYEDSDGDWRKSEYDSNGNEIYFEYGNKNN